MVEPFTNQGFEKFKKFFKGSFPHAAIEEGKRRIMEALKKGRIELREITGEYDELVEIMGFYAEIYLLELLNNTFVKNRTRVAEAKSYYEQRITRMKERDVVELASRLGIKLFYEDGFKIRIEDYLEYSPESIDYSLFLKNIHMGIVEVNEHEAKRILQEAIKKKIEMIRVNITPIKKEFEPVLKEIKDIIPKFSNKVNINMKEMKHPPCIEKILDRLKNHENLGHYERWILAIYLIKIGLNLEEINELYKNLPDYNEKITRYQLKHIKEKNYSMPSCEKIKGYGICVRECGTKNPLEWVYERKRSKVDKK